uniref:Uncharacterized protein n=1 Tax=Vitis vinifera TaxID=29760 RepID=A5BHK0_VITVI|nr:hypothetical protein VITISV_039196 [Vitis vinifera]
MAKTRGAKSSSPSTRPRIPRESLVQATIPEPPRPLVIPPPVEDAPMSPPSRCYQIRRSLTMAGASSLKAKKLGSGPPKKKAKVSEPIDLTEPSLEPESKPQPSQPPAKESQIPSGMTPEVVIKRPMVTKPPIEGNLDCRARSFHFELYFDIAMFRLQPELRDSFHLLQRISEGFFFGPHHLIMATLLYFEEKVHRKKLLRADAIPLLFPRLLCQILEHLGYPSDPQLERRRICREIFTLDKWTSMTAYGIEPEALDGPEHPEIPHPEQTEEPQPIKIPADMRAPAPTVPSTEPIPEVAPSAPPATPRTPHEQIIATQTQHTAILRQIKHHLGIPPTPEHPIPIMLEPTEPSHAPSLVEQTMPPEEPTTGETEASTPSI